MFAGLCHHCGSQSDTYALKLCESCLFCVFCGQVLSPVVSAALPAMNFLQLAFILIGFVRNRSDYSHV